MTAKLLDVGVFEAGVLNTGSWCQQPSGAECRIAVTANVPPRFVAPRQLMNFDRERAIVANTNPNGTLEGAIFIGKDHFLVATSRCNRYSTLAEPNAT